LIPDRFDTGRDWPTAPAGLPRAQLRGALRTRLTLLAGAAAFVLGCPAPAPPPDGLLLVTVDTLRADRLGAFGSADGLTPEIDRLADESIAFHAAYAAAPFTLPSVSALMTGRYPESLGIVRNESKLPDTIPTLATALSKRGWQTRAVVSNFVLRQSSGIDRGFAHFDDDFPQNEVVRNWPERIARDTTDAALARLADCSADLESPCFVWVHYQDPHGPYTPPAELLEIELTRQRSAADADRLLPASADHSGLGGIPDYQLIGEHRDVGFYRAAYHAEIRYLDTEIGRLLQGLRDLGLDERTVVVFTADHGEGLGEDDYWFAHGEFLSEALVQVPLLLRIPGREPEKRADAASLIDVLPTLLGVLGVNALDPPLPGRDLLAPGASQQASSPYMATLGSSHQVRYGLVEDGFKFVVTEQNGIRRGRLSRRGRDEVDITAAAPQIAGPMRKRLTRIRKRILDEQPPELRQDLSTQDREHLRALGYVDPPAEP